jgi:hypothetical protein
VLYQLSYLALALESSRPSSRFPPKVRRVSEADFRRLGTTVFSRVLYQLSYLARGFECIQVQILSRPIQAAEDTPDAPEERLA